MSTLILPVNCGVFGNEVADKLASSVSALEDIAEKAVKPPIAFFYGIIGEGFDSLVNRV